MPTIEHEISFNKTVAGIKSHVKRHQVAYSLGAGFAIAGITCLIMRGRYISLHSGLDDVGLHSGPVIMRPLAFFSKQNVQMNTLTTFAREGRGHPGFPVLCKETGDVFLTQNGGALWAGVEASMMSSHLTKNIPDNLNGFHFSRLPAIPAIAA